MFGIYRIMDDEDGTHMEGYFTKRGEFGIRSEAMTFEDYNEASDELHDQEMYYNETFPNDINSFEIIELD